MRMEKILKQIAKKNGVSIKEVRKEIQRSIDDAWENPPDDGGITTAYQQKVPCKGKVPTPEEIIRYVVTEMKEMNEGI